MPTAQSAERAASRTKSKLDRHRRSVFGKCMPCWRRISACLALVGRQGVPQLVLIGFDLLQPRASAPRLSALTLCHLAHCLTFPHPFDPGVRRQPERVKPGARAACSLFAHPISSSIPFQHNHIHIIFICVYFITKSL